MLFQVNRFLLATLLTLALQEIATSALETAGLPSGRAAALAQNGTVPLTLRSSSLNRRTGLHNGNRVKTKYVNNGGVAGGTSVAASLPSLAWPVETNPYIFDFNVFFGLQQTFRDTIFYANNDTNATIGTRKNTGQPVTIPPRATARKVGTTLIGSQFAAVYTDVATYATVHQGARQGYFFGDFGFEGLEPVEGFSNTAVESPAMSHLRNTWPASWPDHPDWIDADGNPEWNGFFGRGVFNADQESYFVLDDANDRRLYNNFGYLPRPEQPDRYGAGFQIKVRGLQWSNFLAQDNIFWLYEVKNISDTDYDKVFFGSVVGTAVGGEGQTGSNLSVFDQSRAITYSYNNGTARNATWTTVNRNRPVGYAGVAFLESPGNPFDGIDNDDDWQGTTLPTETPDAFALQGSSPALANTGYEFFKTATDSGVSPRTIQLGDILITTAIRDTVFPGYTQPVQYYQRSAVVMDAPEKTVTTFGQTGVIKVGDVLREVAGDLVDNNLNGVIDEDYKLHFRRTRVAADIITQRTSEQTLTPLKFINYIRLAKEGRNLNDPRRYPMIDERRDEGIDNNGNWSPLTDDLGADGKLGSLDFGEGNNRPDPGEPNYDALDVRESDQIGLTSYNFFTNPSLPTMGSSQDLFNRSLVGSFSPTSFTPADGDYVYGSGYFPLKRGQIERFSISIVYGSTAQEVLTNKDIVQQIYDNSYNFTSPPKPEPRLTAIAGDRRVTLYWTADGEEFIDRFATNALNDTTATRTVQKTFEGYRIYRATSPDFQDAFQITGGQGEPGLQKVPLVQFDKINDVRGYFDVPPKLLEQSKGTTFYLGDETGLTHTYTDTAIVNGKTYYYAVVNYSRGDEALGLFPSENSTPASDDGKGNLLLGANVSVVTPRAPEAGYVNPNLSSDSLVTNTANRGNGVLTYSLIDPRKVKSDRQLEFEFFDTSTDGIDNNRNGLVDGADVQESSERQTTYYKVTDITNPVSPVVVVPQSGLVNNVFLRSLDSLSLYRPTVPEGRTDTLLIYRASEETNLIDNTGLFPVITNNFGTKFLRDVWNLPATNDTTPRVTGFALPRTLATQGVPLRASIISSASDYAIVILPTDAGLGDTAVFFAPSLSQNIRFPGPEVSYTVRTNFKVINLTENREMRFFLDPDIVINTSGNRSSTIGTEVVRFYMLEQGTRTSRPAVDTLVSWQISVNTDQYKPKVGDTLFIRTLKPILSGDKFVVNLRGTSSDAGKAKESLERVRVVPNPYIVTNEMEPSLTGTNTRGRGERRIEFTHVPLNSTIRIYTIRGELIRTLRADNPANYGGERTATNTLAYSSSQVLWDLKTSENLDIAYGIYLYHIDAPGIGTKTGKFAIIK